VPFRVTSVGGVLGVLLGDGRRVVVKAHQPRESQTTLWTSRLGSNTFCRPSRASRFRLRRRKLPHGRLAERCEVSLIVWPTTGQLGANR
jgi:hypothetical protein